MARWFKSYPEEVPTSIEIEQLTVVDVFYEACRKSPHHIALIQDDTSLTYEQLKNHVHRLANALIKTGLQKGDRVGLMIVNSIDYVISYYAVLLAGGIVVQNNPMYTSRELYYQLNNSKTKILMIDEKLLPNFPNIVEETVIQSIILTNTNQLVENSLHYICVNESAHFDYSPLNPKDTAVLQYTGGTTGVSKGVDLTHFNIYSNVVQMHGMFGVYSKEGQERMLMTVPLFHVYGMTLCMNYMMYLKSTLVIMERFNSAETLKLISKHKITIFPGTPTIYVAINHDPNVLQYDLTSLHTCISGSAPIAVEVKNRFEEMSGAKIVDAYGLSEASPIALCIPLNGVRKAGSIGVPIPNTEAKVISLEDGKECALDEPGELIIRGPQVMKGYWEMPQETDNTLVDGWLHTGDIAYLDEDGYFFIVGRKKEMIIAGGYNIYPREIEEVIFNYPAVKEVAAVGIPHEYRGETVKVFIVPVEGTNITKEEILEFCNGRLAKYKIPTEVEFRTELPKTTVGKVLRRTLQEENKKISQ